MSLVLPSFLPFLFIVSRSRRERRRWEMGEWYRSLYTFSSVNRLWRLDLHGTFMTNTVQRIFVASWSESSGRSFIVTFFLQKLLSWVETPHPLILDGDGAFTIYSWDSAMLTKAATVDWARQFQLRPLESTALLAGLRVEFETEADLR